MNDEASSDAGRRDAGEGRNGEETTRVVLVEDNDADARLIREMLRDARVDDGESVRSIDLVRAADFTAGVEAVDEGTAVVLLDLHLPDASGMETVDRAMDAFQDTAVVVLTGLDDETVGQDAVERGAQDFLVKDDVDPRTLRRTIRYAVERERQQRELSRRARKLAVLTWVLRHEVRDEATVVVGWGRSLARRVDERDRRYVEEIIEAGEEVIQVTDTVSEFLDALDGDREAALGPVDLRETLHDEVETARRTFEADVSVEGSVPAVAVRGTELTGSVFRNLLTNAVKHNDREHPTVEVTATVEGDEAVVEVADDGPGIPDARKERVFELRDRREGSPGTGVGLFLVETLVEQSGGDIAIRDNDPRGTVVRVCLPVVGDGEGSGDGEAAEGEGSA